MVSFLVDSIVGRGNVGRCQGSHLGQSTASGSRDSKLARTCIFGGVLVSPLVFFLAPLWICIGFASVPVGFLLISFLVSLWFAFDLPLVSSWTGILHVEIWSSGCIRGPWAILEQANQSRPSLYFTRICLSCASCRFFSSDLACSFWRLSSPSWPGDALALLVELVG